VRGVVVAGVVLLGIAVAFWVQGRLVRKLFRAAVVVLGAVVLYAGVTFAQVWWASVHDEHPPSSAIVVLGAAQWNGRPSPVLKARLDHAADLYRAGVAKTVIVTGAKQTGDRVGEGFAGYDYLRKAGIPDADLKIESTGVDTYEELSASTHILDEAGLGRDVVLVSSPYHAHRAKAVAEEVGLRPAFSAAGDPSTPAALARETAAVGMGRLISYRRLSNLQ
jgi:uncharacterized SAM-binding protein YcdF (DUF218 family)